MKKFKMKVGNVEYRMFLSILEKIVLLKDLRAERFPAFHCAVNTLVPVHEKTGLQLVRNPKKPVYTISLNKAELCALFVCRNMPSNQSNASIVLADSDVSEPIMQTVFYGKIHKGLIDFKY